jgi:hypothetical protein
MKHPRRQALATIGIYLSLLIGCEQPKTSTPATPPSGQATQAKAEPPKCSDCIPVTVENFPRAESDLYFNTTMQQAGGIGKLHHYREAMPIDKQSVVRANRDTLYSAAVFDLDAGPVTITLPDAGKRFMSMQVFDEDQYTPMVVYGKGSYTLSKGKIGTRYAMVGIRTLVNPEDPQDLQQVHSLQDAIKITQKSEGSFQVPKWDPASQKKIRDALVTLSSTLPDMKHAFGAKGQVDPVRYLIASAAAWGGNPDKDAIYLNVTPKQNDGKAIYKLHVQKDVPVDGFWSISVYDARGYYESNPYNAYTLNNLVATKDADGSVTVQFGGCDGKIPNCLPIMDGWNYMVRLYRPRGEILAGRWKFPEAQLAQ